jgi:hypothetical protein
MVLELLGIEGSRLLVHDMLGEIELVLKIPNALTTPCQPSGTA